MLIIYVQLLCIAYSIPSVIGTVSQVIIYPTKLFIILRARSRLDLRVCLQLRPLIGYYFAFELDKSRMS